jgi:hypothetical protein
MLTPAQAQFIADGLVEEKKRERAESHWARARRIPRVYRSSALRKLPLSRQTELVEQASSTVSSKWSVLLTCCAWSSLSVGALWLVGSSRLGNWSFALPILLGLVPALGWHAYLVRRELGALLAREFALASVHGPEV